MLKRHKESEFTQREKQTSEIMAPGIQAEWEGSEEKCSSCVYSYGSS